MDQTLIPSKMAPTSVRSGGGRSGSGGFASVRSGNVRGGGEAGADRTSSVSPQGGFAAPHAGLGPTGGSGEEGLLAYMAGGPGPGGPQSGTDAATALVVDILTNSWPVAGSERHSIHEGLNLTAEEPFPDARVSGYDQPVPRRTRSVDIQRAASPTQGGDLALQGARHAAERLSYVMEQSAVLTPTSSKDSKPRRKASRNGSKRPLGSKEHGIGTLRRQSLG